MPGSVDREQLDRSEAGNRDQVAAPEADTAAVVGEALNRAVLVLTAAAASLPQSLPAISGLSSGYRITIVNSPSSAESVLLSPSGTDLINGSAGPVELAPGESATLVTQDGAPSQWLPITSSADASLWSRTWTLDWTSLAGGALADGPNAIDGRTWTGVGEAAAGTTDFGIVAGTGLQLGADGNTGLRALAVAMNDLDARFSVTRPWRLWTRYISTADQDFENSVIHMTNDITFTAAGRGIGASRGAGTERYNCAVGLLPEIAVPVPVAFAGNDLLVVEYQHGVVRLLTGTAGGGLGPGELPATTEGMTEILTATTQGDLDDALPFIDGPDNIYRLGINGSVDANLLTVAASALELQLFA